MFAIECISFGLALLFSLRFAYGLAAVLSSRLSITSANTIANTSCILSSCFWAIYYISIRVG